MPAAKGQEGLFFYFHESPQAQFLQHFMEGFFKLGFDQLVHIHEMIPELSRQNFPYGAFAAPEHADQNQVLGEFLGPGDGFFHTKPFNGFKSRDIIPI